MGAGVAAHNGHPSVSLDIRSSMASGVSRREVLCGAAAAVLGGAMTPLRAQEMIAGPDGMSPQEFWVAPRSVWLRRPGGGDDLRATYWADGRLVMTEYQRICVYMRDVGFERAILRGDPRVLRAVRSGLLPTEIPVAVPMSPRLLDGLYAIGGWLDHFGMARPLYLTSAYRHPFYNSTMVEGAVRNSYHTKGRASDIVIHGVAPQQLSQFGEWLGVGGVGLYVAKGFTHLDDGAQRFWRGK